MTEASQNDQSFSNLSSWENSYRAIRGIYESLTFRLKALIEDLLSDAKIEAVQVEGRTKSIESFTEKITRKREKYQDPFSDITDIVGIRIITYYLEDVVRVGNLIRNEFEVDDANSVDKTASLDPDRFGYSSVHYIVSLSADRGKLGEWKQYKEIRCEIQVRTALQHAWASVNHKLDYKSPREIPNELKRRFYRLSALFELADEQFSELRDARERIASEYENDVRGGQLDIPLDEVSLTAYLQNGGRREALARIISEGGGQVVVPDAKRAARDRRDLLRVLSWIGISSIAQLADYLSAEVLPIQLAGTGLFAGDEEHLNEIGLEDALTEMVMADKNVSKEQYSKIYQEDGWDEFFEEMGKWHKVKQSINH